MKIKIVLALAATLILALAVPAAAQEPLPPQLEYIDVQLDVFLPKLAEYQAKYFEENKGYYQALGSHSLIPSGASGADRLAGHPTDQDVTLAPLWEKAGLPTQIAWAFTINVYDGPLGTGYIVDICTSVELVTWCKSLDYGPEKRNAPWVALGKDE